MNGKNNTDLNSYPSQGATKSRRFLACQMPEKKTPAVNFSTTGVEM